MTDLDERMRAWTAAANEYRGGPHYAELIAAQRLLQDRVAGAALPEDLVPEIARRLDELADALAPYQVGEPERHDGWRPDIPGRAMPVLPPYVIDERSPEAVRGHVTFTRFYLGGRGAVHGGSHTLLFDDVMGQLAGLAGGISRTAYLKLDYRRLTPLDVRLDVDCSLDRSDGRKRFISARLRNPGGDVVAEADALFLALLPGQP